MNNCIFCKIIDGEIPAEKIYEDEKTFAFLDIKPTNHGHTLVIPRVHTRNIFDIAETSLCAMVAAAKRLADPIKKGVGADAINLVMNNEPAAGQLVFHAHLHIVPRFAKDGFRHWEGTPYKEGEAEAVAQKIRAELGE